MTRCEAYTWSEQCQNEATHAVSYFCVHEHGGTWSECQAHVDHVVAKAASGLFYCDPCQRADGHYCRFTLISEPQPLQAVSP